MTTAVEGLLRGALAGAAGTTALNASTYVDMALRGRSSSSTPEESVERVADEAGVQVPGDEETRQNRVSGLGPLLGIATGVGVGAVVGLVLRDHEPPWPVLALVTGAVAMVGANVPMAGLGVSDPRTWSVDSWLSDAVPHLAYGAVTAAGLRALRQR